MIYKLNQQKYCNQTVIILSEMHYSQVIGIRYVLQNLYHTNAGQVW